MEFVKVTDELGNTISFKRFNGRAFFPLVLGNVRDQLTKIAEYQCRPDDVILCTFPKSGTHWVYNMVKMLRTGNLQYTGTPLEMSLHELSELDAMKSPRTYLTHLTYPFIPNDAKNGKVKLIQVMRNPKDIVVSGYEQLRKMVDTGYEGSFDGFLKFFLTDECFSYGGSWFTYFKEWEEAKKYNKSLKILSLRFEDLKKNLYSNIVKISEFLEMNHTEAFLREVEQSVSFENLKREHNTEYGETERFKDFTESGRLPIYRKGEIGDWKNTFTVEQNEKFDKVFKETMIQMGLSVDEFVFE